MNVSVDSHLSINPLIYLNLFIYYAFFFSRLNKSR